MTERERVTCEYRVKEIRRKFSPANVSAIWYIHVRVHVHAYTVCICLPCVSL